MTQVFRPERENRPPGRAIFNHATEERGAPQPHTAPPHTTQSHTAPHSPTQTAASIRSHTCAMMGQILSRPPTCKKRSGTEACVQI